MSVRLDGFARLLDVHGADPARWPDALRAPACALLAASADARRLHHEAGLLDAALRDAAPPADDAALARMRGAVAARIARLPVPEQLSRPAAARRWLRGALQPLVPAGCGALATLAVCALWLSTGSPLQAGSDGIDLLGPAPETLVMVEPEL